MSVELKARFLRPGAAVEIAGRTMRFVERIRQTGCAPVNVFQCQDYVGLDGANDKGTCTMSDHYFRKHAKPMEEPV